MTKIESGKGTQCSDQFGRINIWGEKCTGRAIDMLNTFVINHLIFCNINGICTIVIQEN